MNRWAGRVALVTGASSGIGYTIATRLLRHGLNVVACARHVDPIESIRAEVGMEKGVGELLTVKCDVSREEDIQDMFEQIKKSKFGGVDVCINNAGIAFVGLLQDGRTADWANTLNVNVLGLAICTREALKSMKERNIDDGHIIHISSIAAHVMIPSISMYCASKHAVRALTEGLRLELLEEKSGIRVTEICPGEVKTQIQAKVFGGEEAADEYLKDLDYMSTDDMADAVDYVLSTPKHVQVHDIIIHPIGRPVACQ